MVLAVDCDWTVGHVAASRLAVVVDLLFDVDDHGRYAYRVGFRVIANGGAGGEGDVVASPLVGGELDVTRHPLWGDATWSKE